MASALIHICVAKKINEQLHLKQKELFLGTIAPDIAKQIRLNRAMTHFETKKDHLLLPDLSLFLKKYQENLNQPFELGYYLHLYTDEKWEREFIPKIKIENPWHITAEEFQRILYNDYSTIGMQLIDHYNLDLSLFYEETPEISSVIKEIPTDKLSILVDQMGIIIENAKKTDLLFFSSQSIETFIDETAEEFLNHLKKLGNLSFE